MRTKKKFISLTDINKILIRKFSIEWQKNITKEAKVGFLTKIWGWLQMNG